MCKLISERFGGTTDPYAASDVLYAALPGGPEALEWNERTAKIAEVAAPCWKGNVRVSGAVAYWRGKWQEAIGHFGEAEKVWPLRAWDWLFLAMAHHRLKQTDKARLYFGKAIAWINFADKPEMAAARRGPAWGAWHEAVETRTLLREAEQVLGVKPVGGK